MRTRRQNRNPKSEIRKKAEIRSPKGSPSYKNLAVIRGVRISAFGFLSDFGFPFSALIPCLSVLAAVFLCSCRLPQLGQSCVPPYQPRNFVVANVPAALQRVAVLPLAPAPSD